MGHSRADKQKTHRRIVAIAAKRFRERGLDGIGIADVMKEAGLTVGGFYKHFGSRDELVAEALASSVSTQRKRAEAAAAAGAPRSYEQMVADYLCEEHRDSPGTGCVFAALGPDIGRSGKATRAVATERIRKNVDSFATAWGGKDKQAARAGGIVTLSALVGAMVLARTASDDSLSREILNTVAQYLKDRRPVGAR
ncbi:MAG: TetR/AcrR family transcriptional regulator [Acidobacteria bacterium]|nr:TetR/AcrR family transcriptional regulator [Acidobacteriaceae bacterium]MBV9608844.1 TetR/AcrR family transcriptional regulator [Acidobacteriota bacterium]